jgi:hypothetical protein
VFARAGAFSACVEIGGMALSHIVLHLALCNAALRLKAQSELPVHVSITDKIGRSMLDQTFHAYREEGNEVPVEFDIPWGTYRADIKMPVPHAPCSAVTYFTVLMDHNRTLDVSLQEHPAPQPVPTLIMGSAPFSFSYVDPTVVAFDKGTACNAQVGDPIDAGIVTQNDSDGYYASVVPNAVLMQHAPAVLAVRLTDSHGGYHYIRVPPKVFGFSYRWPSSAKFDVNEDAIDYVADKPEDTLLCPKMYFTSTD